MRLQLTKRTGQAIDALLALGARPQRVKTTELAPRLGTTSGQLHQIMGPLVAAGWVDSTTGPTGGYRLAAPLHDIDLLALIEAIEGPTDMGRCVLERRPCGSADPCAVHVAWQRARASLAHELAATPLSSLATSGSPDRRLSTRKEGT